MNSPSPEKYFAPHEFEELKSSAVIRELATLFSVVREPMLILSADLRPLAANRAFGARFGAEWEIPALRALLERVVQARSEVCEVVIRHRFRSAGERSLQVSASYSRLSVIPAPFVVAILQDVTASAQPNKLDDQVEELTVLLVEDHDLIRTTVRGYLEEQGCRVLEAANGQDALKIAVESPNAIDLLLTDIVLPGLSGLEVAEYLEQTAPGLRVIFMSASYLDDGVIPRGRLVRGENYLEKPFAAEDLSTLLRRVVRR